MPRARSRCWSRSSMAVSVPPLMQLAVSVPPSPFSVSSPGPVREDVVAEAAEQLHGLVGGGRVDRVGLRVADDPLTVAVDVVGVSEAVSVVCDVVERDADTWRSGVYVRSAVGDRVEAGVAPVPSQLNESLPSPPPRKSPPLGAARGGIAVDRVCRPGAAVGGARVAGDRVGGAATRERVGGDVAAGDRLDVGVDVVAGRAAVPTVPPSLLVPSIVTVTLTSHRWCRRRDRYRRRR